MSAFVSHFSSTRLTAFHLVFYGHSCCFSCSDLKPTRRNTARTRARARARARTSTHTRTRTRSHARARSDSRVYRCTHPRVACAATSAAPAGAAGPPGRGDADGHRRRPGQVPEDN